MQFRLGKSSRAHLAGVHQDLIVLVATSIVASPVDFTVLEGRRTLQRQKQLVAEGRSRTLNSRHLTGHAVDVAPWVDGKVSWKESDFEILAGHFKAVAREIGIAVEWGGDWKSFYDGPHWQIAR